MTADRAGWLTPHALAKKIVTEYAQDDRREPNSRDIEIATMICADLAAERAATAEAMREACAKWHDERGLRAMPGTGGAARHEWLAQCIRALPIPDASALHPDDQAVMTFAAEMRAKIAVARAKGRSGWDDPAQCSTAILADLLIGHCAKANMSNFVDIANLAMMLHLRGASTEVASALAERDERMREEGRREERDIIWAEIERAWPEADDLLDFVRARSEGKG